MYTGIWSPHSYPKSDICQSDFGHTNLSALRILVDVGTKRCNVHFLCLVTQSLFMMDDGIDDVIIAERNNQ